MQKIARISALQLSAFTLAALLQTQAWGSAEVGVHSAKAPLVLDKGLGKFGFWMKSKDHDKFDDGTGEKSTTNNKNGKFIPTNAKNLAPLKAGITDPVELAGAIDDRNRSRLLSCIRNYSENNFTYNQERAFWGRVYGVYFISQEHGSVTHVRKLDSQESVIYSTERTVAVKMDPKKLGEIDAKTGEPKNICTSPLMTEFKTFMKQKITAAQTQFGSRTEIVRSDTLEDFKVASDELAAKRLEEDRLATEKQAAEVPYSAPAASFGPFGPTNMVRTGY